MNAFSRILNQLPSLPKIINIAQMYLSIADLLIICVI